MTAGRRHHPGGTIALMPVHVDETLPLHPLSVEDVMGMVDAGILDEDDHVELLDGVLVEMSPGIASRIRSPRTDGARVAGRHRRRRSSPPWVSG